MISQGAVHNYLKRAAAAGIAWPILEGWEERCIEQALFGERQVVKRLPEQVLPDFPALHSQLQQHRHLTLQLAWEEYRQVHPERYGYSRFCELYQRWRGKQDVVLAMGLPWRLFERRILSSRGTRKQMHINAEEFRSQYKLAKWYRQK